MIRYFVLLISRLAQHLHRSLEELRIGIGIGAQFPFGVPQEKFRILFVGQTVSGNMFGMQSDRSLKRRLPIVKRLSRQTEHQINVQIVETRIAQDVKRLCSLRRVVFAAENFQQPVVPRLHAKTDAIYAAAAEYVLLCAQKHSPDSLRASIPAV